MTAGLDTTQKDEVLNCLQTFTYETLVTYIGTGGNLCMTLQHVGFLSSGLGLAMKTLPAPPW